MNKKSLGIACDHAGYRLKEKLKIELEKQGYSVTDYGTHSEESADYPDFAHPLALAIENKEHIYGITLCGSGNGINMTANKHQGVRAALCWTEEISELGRLHNDANICSIPARYVEYDLAKKIIDIFLNTEFEGGRHLRRVNKIPII
jgi:ribose 5-phosphate isomerase B